MDLGGIAIIVLLVVVMPVAVLFTMSVLAGLLGEMLGRSSDHDNTDADGAPNEYLVLSKGDPYR